MSEEVDLCDAEKDWFQKLTDQSCFLHQAANIFIETAKLGIFMWGLNRFDLLSSQPQVAIHGTAVFCTSFFSPGVRIKCQQHFYKHFKDFTGKKGKANYLTLRLRHQNYWIILRRPQEICVLWRQKKGYFDENWGRLQPCFWKSIMFS